MKQTDFDELRGLLQEVSGICLGEDKRSLVKARLSRRLNETGCRSIGEYLAGVRADKSGQEIVRLIDLLSTNVTSFFRESHHFDFLTEEVLPARLADGDPDTVRVWSSACSSGEEPYSLAMTLARVVGADHLRRFLCLATDISSRMVERATNAVYESEQVRTVPIEARLSYLEPAGPRRQRVVAALRDRVRVRRLNLLGRWPMSRSFDVIFCRNALIYFDTATQQRLVQRFHAQLKPGGYFFIGHSESLSGLTHDFEYIKPTIYRRAPRPSTKSLA